MCFFITIAVPEQHAPRLAEAFGRGFQLHPTANATILRAFPAKFAARLLTSGGCSCDLYSRPDQSVRAGNDDHLRRKYAKLGWSQSKIARAVAQSKAHKFSPVTFSGIRGDVIERLKSLGTTAGAVAVVAHWYDGEIEQERLSLTQGPQCGYDEFSARATKLLENEVLFTVFRRAE